MGDIDFEEQLELERLERESKEKATQGPPGIRVDDDGTTYEWDPEKQAWFPKIDTDFIAQYQMNYGVEGGEDKEKQNQEYYQNYYAAAVQQEEVLSRQKKEAVGEESHDESIKKLEHLEDTWQDDGAGQNDSREEMEKYTEEQKKQYNDYWSYYYNTDYHDYYADCMAQPAQEEGKGEGSTEGVEAVKGDGTQEGEEAGKKKGKKRKPPPRPEGWFEVNEEHNTNVYVSGLPFDIKLEEFTEMMTKYGLIMFDPRTKKPKKESVDLILSLLDGADYKGHKVHVEPAQFSMKGNFDPTKKKKKLSNREKNKFREKQAKLFDWRPEKPRGARMKHEKDDPVRIQALKSKMQTECTKYGEVKKVVVQDRHEDGVVQVTFAEAEMADMCVEYMNQRFLGPRRLLAAVWDGQTKYEVQESEAEREARLKKWAEFLEAEEEAKSKSAAGSLSATGTTKVEDSAASSSGLSASSVSGSSASSSSGLSASSSDGLSASSSNGANASSSGDSGSKDDTVTESVNTDNVISQIASSSERISGVSTASSSSAVVPSLETVGSSSGTSMQVSGSGGESMDEVSSSTNGVSLGRAGPSGLTGDRNSAGDGVTSSGQGEAMDDNT
ncbi:HTSF1-like protein [Mya arenaria]|uniref:HTSF1-like protein n=1 Tax=Mya arenaria TaxID=6604 RepID=A0ABY7EFM8_MYAAR|nr:HTSF1-like protein [Mya arenaria]